MSTLARRSLRQFAGLFVTAAAIAAQCDPVWLPGDGTPGLAGGTGYATCSWDPDGPGPASAVIVVGGEFTAAGKAMARNLATYDPATGEWSELGGGTSHKVAALLALPTGELIVGGTFSHAGTVLTNGVARWNGTAWQAFGSGLGRQVTTLQTLPNGDIVAGGEFLNPGGGIAQWNGTQWNGLIANYRAPVKCSHKLSNGDLVFGTGYANFNNLPFSQLCRWDGTTLHAYPTIPGSANAVVAVTELPNNDLIVGLSYGLWRFDGTAWTSFGFSATPTALLPMGGAAFATTGALSSPGNLVQSHLALFDGSNWSWFDGGLSDEAYALTRTPSGDLLAVGRFAFAGGVRTDGVATWNGTAWRELGPSTDGTVYSIALVADERVAAGEFSRIGGVPARNIAVSHNGTWQPLGTGVDGPVHNCVTLPDSSIVAAGEFTHAGGVAAQGIARWDGSDWRALGSGCNAPAHALAVMPDGDLIAAGSFTAAGGYAASRLARWNGLWWTAVGGGVDSLATALLVRDNGDLIVGGTFNHAGVLAAQHIARWDGTTWSALGAGVSFQVNAIAELPDGRLVAAGMAPHYNAPCIAVFDGTTWLDLGNAVERVRALAVLPGGDLAVIGNFTTQDGKIGNRIARWNGSTWSTFATGLDDLPHTMVLSPRGELLVGGAFARAGDVVSAHIATLASACPAMTQPYGAGCPGTGGIPELRASPPWLGETCTLRGQNVSGAIAAGIVGLAAQTVPLTALHPAAGPGCTLLATPDAVLVLVPTNSQVAWQFDVPMTPAFVGLTLASQLLVVEFAGTTPSLLTSSNAVSLTVGTF